MKKTIQIVIPALTGILCITGCYTSFQHPVTDAKGQKINRTNIDITSNCAECHQDGALQAGSMLPASVENDYNWQFYTNSAWWQDEFDFYPVNSINTADPTGPRMPNASSETFDNGITSMPVVQTPSSLGKKSATEKDSTQQEQKDNRRDFNRRQDTQESDEQSQGNDSNSTRKR